MQRIQDIEKAFEHRAAPLRKRFDKLALYSRFLESMYSKTHFLEKLPIALRKHRGPASVIFIDLDQFKDVNDRLGYAVGNATLRAFEKALDKAIKEHPGAFSGRYGGEEIGIFLPVDQRKAAAVVKQIDRNMLGEMDSRFVQTLLPQIPTFSAGIAVRHPEELNTLIKGNKKERKATAHTILTRSMLRMRASKDAGRNRVTFINARGKVFQHRVRPERAGNNKSKSKRRPTG